MAADNSPPGTADLAGGIPRAYAYHLNVMPLDSQMPDVGVLARATDLTLPAPGTAGSGVPVTAGTDDLRRALGRR